MLTPHTQQHVLWVTLAVGLSCLCSCGLSAKHKRCTDTLVPQETLTSTRICGDVRYVQNELCLPTFIFSTKAAVMNISNSNTLPARQLIRTATVWAAVPTADALLWLPLLPPLLLLLVLLPPSPETDCTGRLNVLDSARMTSSKRNSSL